MSEWTARVQNHRIWGLLDSLGPSIDAALKLNTLDAASVEALERLKVVLAFCGKRLGGIDPAIVPPAPLDPIATYIESAKTNVDAFAQDRDAGHLTNANRAVDDALAQIAQVPALVTSQELVGLAQAASSHREDLERMTQLSLDARRDLTAQVEEIRKNFEAFSAQSQTGLAELTSSLEAERQKLATLAAQEQKAFSDAQESRGTTFNETLLKIQESLNKTSTDQQGQFSLAQESRSRDFATAQADSQKRFADIIADYTKKLTEQDAEFTKQREELTRKSDEDLAGLNAQYAEKADKILVAIEGEKARIEKLVGVIGNLGVTSGYLTNANQARRLMWLWQGVTVGALMTLSWLAFHTLPLLEDSKGRFNWGAFAARVLLLASLGVIAAYAGSQADKLFDTERRNRKLALELEAIGPYLAPLPEEEQNKFRIQIGDRSFGRDDESGEKGKSPATLFDVLKSKQSKEAIELIAEIVRKVK